MPDLRAGVPDDGWDARLARLDGHFLQTRAWARFQRRRGLEVLNAAGDRWCWMGVVHPTARIRHLYIPHGPAVLDDAALPEALEDAVVAAREHGCEMVRLEATGATTGALERAGAHRVRAVQPAWTLELDLDVDDTALRRGLTKGHRWSINGAERRGVTVVQESRPEGVEQLLGLMRETSSRTAFENHSDEYFRTLVDELMPTGDLCLYFALVDGTPVAGALGFDSLRRRYYAFAGGDSETARRLSAGAPVVWRMVLDARARGAVGFDFWGVAPDDDPDHPWAGFSRFKRSFGGRLVERVGTWELSGEPGAVDGPLGSEATAEA